MLFNVTPLTTKDNMRNVGLFSPIFLRDLSLLHPKRSQSSYFPNIIVCKLSAVMIGAARSILDMAKYMISMFNIFRMRHYFQVFQSIIMPIAVFVINFQPFWNRKSKGFPHKAMDNAIGSWKSFSCKGNLGISAFRARQWCIWGWRNMPSVPFADPNDFSMVADFVNAFISDYIAPFFSYHSTIITQELKGV